MALTLTLAPSLEHTVRVFPFNEPYPYLILLPTGNLTEIDLSFDLMWRNNIDSSQVVMVGYISLVYPNVPSLHA